MENEKFAANWVTKGWSRVPAADPLVDGKWEEMGEVPGVDNGEEPELEIRVEEMQYILNKLQKEVPSGIYWILNCVRSLRGKN